nr:hypothetical protein [Candidatus Sigynarchaeota archaeon]
MLSDSIHKLVAMDQNSRLGFAKPTKPSPAGKPAISSDESGEPGTSCK